MNHDDISRLVDVEDFGSKSLVQPLVVLPRFALCSTICGNMLLVVEELIELVLCKAAPAALVLQEQITIGRLVYIVV